MPAFIELIFGLGWDLAFTFLLLFFMAENFPFLPMSLEEAGKKGWSELDVIIISGDAYVDHPSFGPALIGRLLESKGYRVGIIAQPKWNSIEDFKKLGRPRLCFCICAGNMDSMVANYTANKHRRKIDNYSPQGKTGARPDRASIVYSNMARQAFKNVPIILGGTEASMRRLAHYDYWDDKVRRSILLDAKADMIVYGMAEKAIVEVVNRLNSGKNIGQIKDVRGTVVIVKQTEIKKDSVILPSFEEVSSDKKIFNKAFVMIYSELNQKRGRIVIQKHKDQFLMQIPPSFPLSTEELDMIYDLPYARAWHPSYDLEGGIKAFETVKTSITALRGCPGECNFCGLTLHQGRIVQSRSPESIVKEVKKITEQKYFKGTISDIGGPTANLYAAYCNKWNSNDPCEERQCLMPKKCPNLNLNYQKTLELYEKVQKINGVKHVFIGSGLRYDLFMDKDSTKYLKTLCERHISGQMKIAPEHTEDSVLKLMNKPPYSCYEEFVEKFEEINSTIKSRKYLVNYFISAHPGCHLEDTFSCAMKLKSKGMAPEQIQDYLPLPMTFSACMYYTGEDPFTGKKIYTSKSESERIMHRALLQSRDTKNRTSVSRALRLLKKEKFVNIFLRQRKLKSSKNSK